MSHLLIVGQKFSSLTDYITSHGHTYTLLQDIKRTKFPDKKFKRRTVADFSNTHTLIEAVSSIKEPIDGVITTYENYVLPAAHIARHLGLPGMPIQAAEACTDKFLMRSLFADALEKISPAFATVTSREDVITFANNHSFPLILKPANLAKSLLVTKSHDLDELLENYDKSASLLPKIYQKYAPDRTPKLLIEEFLEGTIHSVDAFVDGEGTPRVLENVVDYQTGYDIGFDDNFHYSRLLPSKLPDRAQEALRHCAEIGIKALGMKSSPAHIEIIMTKNGPRIVEIGARNGGYRERMHSLANDIDITANALALALNQPLDISAKKSEHIGVFELFPKVPGTFTGISHQQELENLPSLNYLSVKAKPGELIGKSSDGYKMTAVVILHNDDEKQFTADMNYLNEHVAVKVSQ